MKTSFTSHQWIESRSDNDLARIAAVNSQAFGELFERHALDIRSWIRGQILDDQLADDLTSEVFADAWINLKRFRWNDPESSFGAWLQGIAKNQVRRTRRNRRISTKARNRMGIDVEPSDQIEDLIDRISADSQGEDLGLALDELADETRSAISLRVVEERPYIECAEELGCSQPLVRKRVSRGLLELRKYFERGSNA